MIPKVLFGSRRKKIVFVLVAAALLLGAGAGAVFSVGVYPIASQGGGQEQMSEEEAADIRRLFDDQQGTWGFVSRYGRTGRIQLVQEDEKTLEVSTPKGSLRVKVGDDTSISKTEDGESKALTFEDLTPGTLVTVDGSTGTKEGADAGEIQVIPEGEGGFDITPSDSSGPRLVPLFP